MKAFEIEVNGRRFDYRVGSELNLKKIQLFLKRKYKVRDLSQKGRHVLGIVELDGKELFLKLATTEGISYLIKAEYEWNEQFNRENQRQASNYWVPQNYDFGLYENKLFYFVTDIFDGLLLAKRPEKSTVKPVIERLPAIIEFSELIQDLNIEIPGRENNSQEFFRTKALVWFQAIPEKVRKKYRIDNLLDIIERSYQKLGEKTRHGDFTPWHLLVLGKGKLGLIDGEHAMGSGVEYYDIAYFIQRIFCVLENPDLAKNTASVLIDRKYDPQKLKTVLAARGLGGFLDESLKEKPNYEISSKFKDFVFSIN